MDASLIILVFLIAVALLFDFLNGLHDAANSIATIVATRVLPPVLAVGWAACGTVSSRDAGFGPPATEVEAVGVAGFGP